MMRTITSGELFAKLTGKVATFRQRAPLALYGGELLDVYIFILIYSHSKHHNYEGNVRTLHNCIGTYLWTGCVLYVLIKIHNSCNIN